MIGSRRAFLRSLGLALAGVAVARCGGQRDDDTPRGRVRRAWLALGDLGQQTQRDHQRGEATRDRIASDHRAALEELVSRGELAATVAEDAQIAFEAAAYHIWRANAPITCYEPVLVDYVPVTAASLAEQAELLTELAGKGEVEPATLARAQAAVARDIAFLKLSDIEEQALYDRLIQASQAGSAIPPFSDLELSIPADATEAARFLVELLSE